MPDIKHVLSSPGLYKQAFEDGLTRILQHKTAGTFILACANIFQHPKFLENNKAHLHEVYTYIKEYYQACQREGKQPEDTVDDITAMNNIIEIGLENLDAVQTREIKTSAATFLLNYNQLRSFRPARMSKMENVQLDTAFNAQGFHFNKPFLEKETFAQGNMQDRQLCLLYNKFPFVKYHALLVLDKEQHNNQLLTEEYLVYMAELQSTTQQQLPGFVVAYNSLGAGASVNHLHFHVYLETTPLPIFSAQYRHNGGDHPYPATCQVFTDPGDAWQVIQSFHDKNTPYNLLFHDRKIYCLPRKLPQKTFKDLDVTLYGWSNMAGLIHLNDKEAFAQISVNQLMESLAAVSLQ
jgi:ATP adenylyltransferase/5',5'''-P-1,P-4-tetraphosphate phosphorylase II